MLCRFLDRPRFLVGTAVPDWMMVADRPLRLRAQHAEACLDHSDPRTAEVAAGVLQHFRDDARFHGTKTFAKTLTGTDCQLVRDALGGETGLRPAFLGYPLAELLLDAALISDLGETG